MAIVIIGISYMTLIIKFTFETHWLYPFLTLETFWSWMTLFALVCFGPLTHYALYCLSKLKQTWLGAGDSSERATDRANDGKELILVILPAGSLDTDLI